MDLGKPLPGETPLDDISGLKVKGVTTRGQLNALEAENIRKAALKYLAKKPTRRTARFDLGWFLKLHKDMFGDVWSWAGKLRTCNLNIGVDSERVETRLFALTKDLEFWEKQKTDLVEQAALLHHGAVFISPFLNGNGRWARMLANVWLKRHKHPVILWPEPAVGMVSTIRKAYLNALRKADNGDLSSLVAMQRKFTEGKE